MANRFWVGGTSSWNATAGTKWSTTSGGAGGAAIPTSADDVFFDAASGASTVSLGAGVVARSINCTGFTGTISHTAATGVTIGDATAGASNIALKTVAGMTYTIGSATTSTITFASTSATQQDMTTGGKTWPTYTIDGVGSSYRLTDANTVQAGSTVTLTNGTFNTNGQTCSWGFFSSNNSNSRTLTLGGSSITLTGGAGTHWDVTGSLTLNANTSTITFSYTSTCTANFAGLTYNNVVFNYLMGIGLNFTGSSTFANLTFTGTTGTTTNQSDPSFSGDNTITGTLTMTGLAANVRMGCRSNVTGTARTLTAAIVSLTNVDFRDITAAGAAIPFTGTSLGDAGGNTNITFTTPVTRYAVAAGNWASTGTWSATSGGASGASVPLPQDAVFLNAASGAIAVSNSMFYPGKNIDFTGFTGTLSGSTAQNVLGNITLSSGMTITSTSTYTFRGRGSQTITSAGQSFPNNVTIDCAGGSYSLSDALIANGASSGTFNISSGTFNSNNFAMSIYGFSVTSTTLLSTINLGTSTVSLNRTDASNIIDIRGTVNNTWNIASSTFVIANASVNQRVINASLGNITFGNLTYTVAGSAGRLIIQGSNHSFNNINFSDATTARNLRFGLSVFTIRGLFNVNGSAGIIQTIDSTVGGSAFTLTKPSGTVSCDYLSIKDSTATGGAFWYAGANSTNVSGNTGWIFTAPPTPPIVASGIGADGGINILEINNLAHL